MRVLGTILLGLVALFTGGCSLILISVIITDGFTDLFGLLALNLVGLAISGGLIWLIWRKKPSDDEPHTDARED